MEKEIWREARKVREGRKIESGKIDKERKVKIESGRERERESGGKS